MTRKIPCSQRLVSALLTSFLLLGGGVAVAQQLLYRFIDDDGIVVIQYQIPPEYVHKGYEVLNTDGTVNKVVPRALTEEELRNRSIEEIREIAEAAERARQRKRDESLLLRYSTVEDIEAARDRTLSELRIRVSILRSNVRSLRSQVESNQAKAADIERSGGEVPVDVIAIMERLHSKILETEQAVVDREREMAAVKQKFSQDMERFGELLEFVRRIQVLDS